MAQKATAHIVQIQADKLIAKLSQSKYFIGRCEDFQLPGEWFLFHKNKSGRPKPIGKIASDLINEFISSGVLKVVFNRAELTKTGRSYVKRALVNHNNCLGQHQTRIRKTVQIDGSPQDLLINAAESPLAWLAMRKDRSGKPMIDTHQFTAGERLRADFEQAHLSSCATSNWDRMAQTHSKRKDGAGASLSVSEVAWDAKQRVRRALEMVGPDFSGILLDVCCEQRGIEAVEKQHGLPKRSGKVVLRMALNQLARHYGLLSDTQVSRSIDSRISHWGVPDYRPSIEG